MSDHPVHVRFHEEKKAVVTNILDSAVKSLGLDQSDYIALKAKILELVEAPGNELMGLSQVVTRVNESINEVTDHEGLVIVEAEEKGHAHRVAGGSVTKEAAIKRTPVSPDRGKALKLLDFLTPYLSLEEIESYKTRMKGLPMGECMGFGDVQTTGDLEKEIALKVRRKFKEQLDEIAKKFPRIFIDEIEMEEGESRKINLRPQMEKQLQSIQTVSEFLSLRDLIGRHIKAYRQKVPEKKSIFEAFASLWSHE